MYGNDKDKMNELVQELGSPFAAAIYSAKLSRQYIDKTHGVITGGEAMHWAITGEEPSNLHQRMERYKSKMSQSFYSDEISSIDDKDIREAGEDSVRTSTINKKLTYKYKNISEPNKQARIRVLTKIIYMNRYSRAY